MWGLCARGERQLLLLWVSSGHRGELGQAFMLGEHCGDVVADGVIAGLGRAGLYGGADLTVGSAVEHDPVALAGPSDASTHAGHLCRRACRKAAPSSVCRAMAWGSGHRGASEPSGDGCGG